MLSQNEIIFFVVIVLVVMFLLHNKKNKKEDYCLAAENICTKDNQCCSKNCSLGICVPTSL